MNLNKLTRSFHEFCARCLNSILGPTQSYRVNECACAAGKPALPRNGARRPECSYDYDVIVVGGGAGGATFAYACARAGKSVLVLERGDKHHADQPLSRRKGDAH